MRSGPGSNFTYMAINIEQIWCNRLAVTLITELDLTLHSWNTITYATI